MQLDSSQMGGHRLGHVQFGSVTSVSTQMYSATASPTEGHAPFVANSANRIRKDGFDISMGGVTTLGQSSLETMPSNSIGAAYGQAAAAAAATSSSVGALSHQAQGPQLHHHHHLPDLGHLSKSMRRDDGSGAPSMVGQAGMPPPAPRPRGPKLKFTAEDDQLLIELKEQKNLTWKQIADFFPGRSSGTLQVRYCTKLKAKTTQWTDEMDHKLRTALADYENEKWRIVAHKVGSGFTPAACRERVLELMGADDPDTTWQSMSPRSASAAEESDTMELPQIHRPWHGKSEF
ncbi:Myb domain protein [Metarhizium robertsii]|uniref:MYB-like protein n=2 Tax=Metarhizium robertsii TaxID=568076 RepID=E9F9J1_METRA|nr:MYB-like protein [Metarhizium robertsii ARSEF 23]EFY95644.1 MYB-like protein [Metarhizium robertsii ARSEF 23]EXU97287.1 Myb domain protein [Metarhizium robertsii]